jgi:hypothetical protein
MKMVHGDGRSLCQRVVLAVVALLILGDPGEAATQLCPPTHEAAVVEKLAEKYERRPRHKTRPDKYELKVHKTALEKTHITLKCKRRKKAGLALNNDFKAPKCPTRPSHLEAQYWT